MDTIFWIIVCFIIGAITSPIIGAGLFLFILGISIAGEYL